MKKNTLILLSIGVLIVIAILAVLKFNYTDGDSTEPVLSSQKNDSIVEFKGLVILVEFEDVIFTIDNPKEYFFNLLNASGYSHNGAKGSARDYFIANSDSLFIPMFDVIGPITLSRKMEYYGKDGENGEEIHAQEMITEACLIAHDSLKVDFSAYDMDNNDFVDMIYVFFASYGQQENENSKEYIWPHAGNIENSLGNLNGKRVSRYICSPELMGSPPEKTPSAIGIFCHEFSHFLGLPDFYNTLSSSGFTPNNWSIMDRGNYLDNARCPAGYSSFERESLGWLEVPVVESTGEIILSPIARSVNNCDTLRAFKVLVNSKEAFYFENRKFEKWDTYLPSQGMIVFYVDKSNPDLWNKNEVNTNFSHHNYELIRNHRYSPQENAVSFPGNGQSLIDTTILNQFVRNKSISFSIRDIEMDDNGFIHLKFINHSIGKPK